MWLIEAVLESLTQGHSPSAFEAFLYNKNLNKAVFWLWEKQGILAEGKLQPKCGWTICLTLFTFVLLFSDWSFDSKFIKLEKFEVNDD